MDLKNILQSSYDFGNDEYELKLKYILFNSLLIFNIFIVGVATFVRLANLQYANAFFDSVYVTLGLITFILARRSKQRFNSLVNFVIFFSYLIVTLSFSTGLNYIAGISWYFILLMTVFFLKGNREGVIVFILSLVSIILITLKEELYSSTTIALGIIPFFGALVFMYFFEQRNQNLKKRLENQKAKYLHQAQYDDLTNIANRALFIDRLEHASTVAKRSNEKIAIIFMDLDHFKEINDSYGHYTGDKVLIEVANRLKSQIRESDTIARLGGDEYSIILNKFGNIDAIKNIIHKLINVMQEPILVENKKLSITLSLGVTIYPDDGIKTDILLRNADSAMYKAKANGKNGYAFYKKPL